MANVVAAITMSVDGYITGPDDGPGKGLGDGGERLHYWVFGGPWSYQDEPQGGPEGVDAEYFNEMTAQLGAMLRRVVLRLPKPLQRALFKGGQRSDRLRDPDAVIALLGLRPRDRVADLGPGYGHFTLSMCRALAPDGLVYAADADADTLNDLRRAADARAITNLRPVLTSRQQLELPEPVDLLFVAATYHHLREPEKYFANARSMIRPGGRVAILESRLEGVAARWMNPHGTVPSRLQAEMGRAGYKLVETHDTVYGHWYGVFTI